MSGTGARWRQLRYVTGLVMLGEPPLRGHSWDKWEQRNNSKSVGIRKNGVFAHG